MSAAALRISRWFGGAAAGDVASGAGSAIVPTHASARRKLFDDIGDFLFAHDLDISDRNFAATRAYLTGDRDVVPQVEAELRDGRKLTDAFFAALAAVRPDPLAPDKLAGVAEQLNARLVECLQIVGQSSAFAQAYGSAIDHEAQAFQHDPLGTVDRLLALTHDVVHGTLELETQLDSAQKETQRLRSRLARARREADHDHLTGLLNRRSFENRMASLPSVPSPGDTMCIALCDIDQFKTINDEHGHDTGDRVLRYFARRLRTALEGQAVVARYGGEEFVCLFEATTMADAAARLETIRAQCAAKTLFNRANGRPMAPLTFSTGLAMIDGDAVGALAAADRALYEAKRTGRNRLVTAPYQNEAA